MDRVGLVIWVVGLAAACASPPPLPAPQPAPAIRVVVPPPLFPPHLHHHDHAGTPLIFDRELGVYRVLGRQDHYFHRDLYFRFHTEGWDAAVGLEGPWSVVAIEGLPPGLRVMDAARAPRHELPPASRAD